MENESFLYDSLGVDVGILHLSMEIVGWFWHYGNTDMTMLYIVVNPAQYPSREAHSFKSPGIWDDRILLMVTRRSDHVSNLFVNN